MDKKNKWIIAGVVAVGLSTAFILMNKKKVSAAGAAPVATEPTTNTPVTSNQTIATTNTTAQVSDISSGSFIGVDANGNTINTDTTPAGTTTYSKYGIGQQLTLANSAVAGRIYTVTAIQAGYYVMSYQGGGPLTEQCTIVDNDGGWSLYTPQTSSAAPATFPVIVPQATPTSTPAPSTVVNVNPVVAPSVPAEWVVTDPIIIAPLDSAAAATQNGTFQTVVTPNAGNGSGTETIATYGLGTSQPYEIINGEIVYE